MQLAYSFSRPKNHVSRRYAIYYQFKHAFESLHATLPGARKLLCKADKESSAGAAGWKLERPDAPQSGKASQLTGKFQFKSSIDGPEPKGKVETIGMGWKVLVAYTVTLLVNFGSNTGLINGMTNAEVSAMHPTPLTPAAWAFGIWSIIFLAQGISAYILSRKNDVENKDVKAELLNRIGPSWIAGWFCQSVWQLLFCTNTAVSLAWSALLLMGACQAFHGAMVNTEAVIAKHPSLSLPTSLVLNAASAVNAAWLSVAASLGILVAASVNTERSILSLALVLASLVAANGVLVGITRKNLLYVLTLLWAFTGVYVKQAAHFVQIKKAMIVGIVALCVTGAWALWSGRVSSSQHGNAQPA